MKPLLLLDPANPKILTRADWKRANQLFEHPSGCQCSTCHLAATLGHWIRKQENVS